MWNRSSRATVARSCPSSRVLIGGVSSAESAAQTPQRQRDGALVADLGMHKIRPLAAVETEVGGRGVLREEEGEGDGEGNGKGERDTERGIARGGGGEGGERVKEGEGAEEALKEEEGLRKEEGVGRGVKREREG